MIQSFSKLGTKNFLNLIKGIYIYLQQYLSRYVSSGKGNKSKNKQMGLHPTKKLLHSEGNYHQKKSQPTDWKTVFPNDMSDKGLIYKELQNI